MTDAVIWRRTFRAAFKKSSFATYGTFGEMQLSLDDK